MCVFETSLFVCFLRQCKVAVRVANPNPPRRRCRLRFVPDSEFVSAASPQHSDHSAPSLQHLRESQTEIPARRGVCEASQKTSRPEEKEENEKRGVEKTAD